MIPMPQLQSLIQFPFLSRVIRTRLDHNGQPWFCASDVCYALNIKNSRDAIEKLDEDERDDVGVSDTIGRLQPMNFISESGLYTLIFRCHDALEPGTDAHRFRKWVTGEVLPKLRQQGYFGVATPADYLKAAKTAAGIIRQIVQSKDMCEQYYLYEIVQDLSRTMGVKAPDLTLLTRPPKPAIFPGGSVT